MPTLMYTESLSMVKKLGPHSWLTALKRVFRYPTKTRQCKQDEEEEKQKREKGRRWFSCKAAENKDETAATAVAAEIISRAPPSSRLPCAATVIQTAFRCYLAKRALVALKGIVKLQALIRGQNVRRQAQITLKCMQALFRVQDRMREQCSRISHDSSRKSVFSESNNSWESKYIRERKAILRDHCSDAWRDCPPTLQELEVMLQAQNAAFMREKRLSQAWNSETDLVDGEERAKTPLKQGKTLVRNHRHKKSLCNSLVQSPATPSPAKPKPVQVRPTTSPRYLEKSHSAANTPRICPANKSTIFTPRFSTSGITPSYMAATESAKARSRSQSAPKKRPSTPDRERGALQEKSNLHFRSGGSVKRQLSYSTAIFKNGEVRMEQRSEYSCNTESVGGEISPCSTTNSSRWWSR